jgi:hypothetical protein
MAPAPTSIAATPSTRTKVPWNPAVPPPPVAGAAVAGATVGLAVAGATVGLSVGGEVVGAAGATVGLPVPVSGAVGVVIVGVGDSGAVAEEDSEGEDEGGSDAEGDVVQAEITAEASRATMPKPTAASLALSPVPEAVVCAVMEPPHASGRWRPCFPVVHQKPASEAKPRGRPGRCPRRLKAGPRKRRGP